MPADILFSKSCSSQFKTRVVDDAFKEAVKQLPLGTGRIHCCENYRRDAVVFDDYVKMYIFSDKPFSHLQKIKAMVSAEGVNILSITADCHQIYEKKLAEHVANYLLAQAYLTVEQVKSYQLVLQEALVNAVEYGCLDMAGLKNSTINGDSWFEKYRKIIQERLLDEAYAYKKITLQCTLQGDYITTIIEDEGKGFQETIKKQKDDSLNALEVTPENTQHKPHGMGCNIISGLSDKYAYEKNGARLIFKFTAPFIHSADFGFEDAPMSVQQLRRTATVLIVDDQQSNREFAKIYLKSAGYEKIIEAASGIEAIEKAQTEKPDLIILDILMPEMDGFTVCRTIKQSKDLMHIPILFLSGLDDPESKIRGYRIGAVDYVSKPIDRSELVARADTHIKSGKMLRALKEYSARTKKDLARAAQMQSRLIPSEHDLDIVRHKHGVQVEHTYQACDELAGDYWTMIDLGEGEVGIALADFTGHGLVAALNTIRLHALFQEFAHELKNPTAFTMALNDKLFHQTDMETFMTFTYAVINTQTGHIKYTGCGSPPIAVLPKNAQNDPYFLDCSGLPLGLVPSSSFHLEEREAHITEGDAVIFYSDALVETVHTSNNEMWQDDGLMKALKNIQQEHSIPSLDDLLKRFNATAERPLRDDLTLVMLALGAQGHEEMLISQLTKTSKSSS